MDSPMARRRCRPQVPLRQGRLDGRRSLLRTVSCQRRHVGIEYRWRLPRGEALTGEVLGVDIFEQLSTEFLAKICESGSRQFSTENS